jgi:hypothetical protein
MATMSPQPLAKYFLKNLRGSSLLFKRKAVILVYSALFSFVLDAGLVGIMFATGATAAGSALLSYALSLALILFAVRRGKYEVASSVFVYWLMVLIFVAIKFDAYQNVYEFYVLGTLYCFLLLLATVVAYRPVQVVTVGLFALTALAVLYFTDIRSLPGTDKILTIQSLVTVFLILTGAIAFACISIILQRDLFAHIEADLRESEERCKYLKTAISKANRSSYQLNMHSILSDKKNGDRSFKNNDDDLKLGSIEFDMWEKSNE